MGATSGIGKEVAIILAQNGYEVGIAGRRENLLIDTMHSTEGIVDYQVIDLNSDDAPDLLHQLIARLGGIDLYFHSSGIGFQNVDLDSGK